jgi:hypothetical protein
MPPTAVPSRVSPRILAEELRVPDEPLALLLRGGPETTPAAACAEAARALLDLPAVSPHAPSWLAPHQIPAHNRLIAIVTRHGGAVLADAVGLGKSYVALAVATTLGAEPILVVPAVLVPQWRALMDRLAVRGRICSHERLSREPGSPKWHHGQGPSPLCIVDEAHHFRNPLARRYRALAQRVIGSRLLLVSATPVHHRAAELLHLLRLFLRDDALVALGVPSLARAARDDDPGPVALAAVARFVVARSRRRVTTAWHGLGFPRRAEPVTVRAAPAAMEIIDELARGIAGLRPPGGVGPLFRLTLMRRLASSVPALRESLKRFEAFCAVQRDAAAAGHALPSRVFRRLFPMTGGADLQLAFLPLLLETSTTPIDDPDAGDRVRRLLERTRAEADPKSEALERLLADSPAKTIVFVDAAATVHHLRRRLAARFRIGAVAGAAAWLGLGRVTRREVLEAFAPHAHGVAPPRTRSRVDILIATDLVGEGLNLQDAERVVHYDLPWSPARLAQRVGRVDRLASPHETVATVAFLPPEPLASAIAIEQRLARKVVAQLSAGVAQVETLRGLHREDAPLDWCDRLQPLAYLPGGADGIGAVGAASGRRNACVLVMRLGELVEAIVVERGVATANPGRAASLLEEASLGSPLPVNRSMLDQAIRVAAPLLRDRCAAIAAARWRTADRDGAGRRLVPLVLASARRAAHAGHAERLARLDALVARLSGGQAAGEALLLDQLLERRRPLEVSDLLAWHDHLPPLTRGVDAPEARLVAAIVLAGPS